ncbi:MAG: SsrA-binding protein SmpB [Patescibacteria group bacterium]|jgi:SsrA-binding protein|nr:SsrA-binding protein SmpB [Patescibacteria group bacterium]
MPTLAFNKKARYDFEITETFEAGMVLFGHEVKSMKEGHISLKGAYIVTQKGNKILPDFVLRKARVSPYKKANTSDYDPERDRKLLLNKKEINYLIGKYKEGGFSLIPIKIYTKKSLIKLEFGLGRGKKKHDKREDIKKKDVERQMRTLTKYK